MSLECPFSPKSVNERVVRLVALLAVLLMLTGIFSDSLIWFALFLCLDLFIRGFTDSPWSPIRRAAMALARLLRLKPKMINAGPKIFAAKVGFIFCALITVAEFTGLHTAAVVLATILIGLATLEAGFGFCVGCHIYSLIQTVKKSLNHDD